MSAGVGGWSLRIRGGQSLELELIDFRCSAEACLRQIVFPSSPHAWLDDSWKQPGYQVPGQCSHEAGCAKVFGFDARCA